MSDGPEFHEAMARAFREELEHDEALAAELTAAAADPDGEKVNAALARLRDEAQAATDAASDQVVAILDEARALRDVPCAWRANGPLQDRIVEVLRQWQAGDPLRAPAAERLEQHALVGLMHAFRQVRCTGPDCGHCSAALRAP